MTDQNGLPTLELRLAIEPGEVDERMCAPVKEIGDDHEIHHMPYRSCANTA